MAARYWVNGGNGNWNSTTNWSATSGGSSGASVPTSSDDVFFDSAGNSNSTISATITVLSLTIDSGYTATMTHNAVLTVAGNVTFGANYTIAGTSAMTLSATCAITSNGKTWPNNMTFSGSTTTKTLVGNFVIGGSLTVSGSVTTINRTTAETLTTNGIAVNQSVSGTAEIILSGGTWSGSSSIGLTNNLTFNGTITVSGTVVYGGGILRDNGAGVVTTSSATLSIRTSCTLDCAATTWNNIITPATSVTLTLNDTLNVTTFTAGTAALTFDGTDGMTVGNWIINDVTTKTIILQESITYTVTTSLECYKSRVGAIVLFTSSSGTVKANLVMVNPSLCNVLASFTRIDASGGRTINSFGGAITDCVNVRQFYDLATVGHP